MAARLLRSSSPLINQILKSTADNSHANLVGPSVSNPRRFSSSGSSSSKANNNKKLTERLSSVIDGVNDRKLPPELRGQRNCVRSETDIMGVVEQRIWQSMEEGQFEKLAGKGRPLNLNTNPHADPAEDTLYRILSKNGCAPEWVELNKEIRSRVAEWRLLLKTAWRNKGNGVHSQWVEDSEALKAQMRDINDKVFRYNLIVPFGRQMFGLKWDKEVDRLNDLKTQLKEVDRLND